MRQDVGEPEEAGNNIPDEVNEVPVQPAGDHTPPDSPGPQSPQIIHLSEGTNPDTVTSRALTTRFSRLGETADCRSRRCSRRGGSGSGIPVTGQRSGLHFQHVGRYGSSIR